MKKAVAVLAILVVCLIGWNVYQLMATPKTVFVDISKLHSKYRLKNELEGKMNGRLQQIKNVLDSLQMVRKLSPRVTGYTKLDTNIARMEFEMQRSYEKGTNDLSFEVWNHLNPLIQKYGETHNYSIIIGASGTGTVLYGKAQYDITDLLINYVNASN